jgi:LacI family transcriptional regulator
MTPDPDHVVAALTDPGAGANAFRQLMATPSPPAATIAATGNVAIGVLHAAYLDSWAIPEQISVVGFDDIPQSAFTAPPLTTVHNPIVEIATLAIDLAVSRGVAAPAHHVLAPGFTIRATTGPAPS